MEQYNRIIYRILVRALAFIVGSNLFIVHELKAQNADSVDYKSLISLPLDELLKLKVIGVSKY